MDTVKIFTEDLLIKDKLIKRDRGTTMQFFFKTCMPIFMYFQEHYVTDCESWKELASEIYVLLMAPGKKFGRSQMENYRGACSLKRWVAMCTFSYCKKCFKKKKKENTVHLNNLTDEETDQIETIPDPTPFDMTNLAVCDFEFLLSKIRCDRYRKILRLYYLELMSASEISEVLHMPKANFYSKFKLANDQLNKIREKYEK